MSWVPVLHNYMNNVIIDMSARKTDDNSRAKGGSGMRLDLIAATAAIISAVADLGGLLLLLVEHREERHPKQGPKHKRR